jgi:hypothetical protein
MTETVLPIPTTTVEATAGAINAALKEPPPAPGDGYQFDHPCAAHLKIVNADKAVLDAGPTPRRKLAVCGFASSSRALIPVNDATWEVWGMNQLYRHIPRADRWFDIHWNWDKETVPGTDYRGWLSTCGIPVYMMAQMTDLPTSVRYPVTEMIAMAGDYFTSTVAFMVALAIDEIDKRVAARVNAGELNLQHGPEYRSLLLNDIQRLYSQYTIGLFGIDLVVEEEYFWQKPCAEFWCGMAVGRGIEVFIPPQSALCKQMYRYGYEPEPQTVIRPSEIQQHHKKLSEERQQLINALYLHDGAMQADEYWQRLVELRARGAEVRL